MRRCHEYSTHARLLHTKKGKKSWTNSLRISKNARYATELPDILEMEEAGKADVSQDDEGEYGTDNPHASLLEGNKTPQMIVDAFWFGRWQLDPNVYASSYLLIFSPPRPRFSPTLWLVCATGSSPLVLSVGSRVERFLVQNERKNGWSQVQEKLRCVIVRGHVTLGSSVVMVQYMYRPRRRGIKTAGYFGSEGKVTEGTGWKGRRMECQEERSELILILMLILP